MESNRKTNINIDKEVRLLQAADTEICKAIQNLKEATPCRQISIVITKLEESTM